MHRCLLLSLLFSILVGQALLRAQPAAKSYACEAPADIQASIDQASLTRIDALLEQDPNNFWLLRAYIDATIGRPRVGTIQAPDTAIPKDRVDESVIDRYRKKYAARPSDPEAAYLYAYALVHRDTGKSIEILDTVTQQTPSFPSAWLTLAVIHNFPNYFDQAKQRKYAENYIAQCPNTIESRIAGIAMKLDRSDALTNYVKSLRARIAGRADEKTLPLYTSLWELESRVAVPSKLDELKRRLQTDLEFLEGLDKTRFMQVDQLLAQGYRRTVNKEVMEKRISGMVPPLTSESTSVAYSFIQAQIEWNRMNPQPAPDASRETRISYYKKQLQFLDEWRDKNPQNLDVLMLRTVALGSIPDTPDDVLVRDGDQALAAVRARGGGYLSQNFLNVLWIWAKRGLRLDRIPALVNEIAEAQSKMNFPLVTPKSDLYGENYQSLITENLHWTTNTRMWTVLVIAYTQSRQFDQARETLAEWEKALNERRKKADEINEKLAARLQSATPSERSNVASNPISSLESSLASGIYNDEGRYHEACAQLAVAEERSLDALAYYQSYLRLLYGRYPLQTGFTESEAAKDANSLWKKLGGSEAGWLVWLNSIWTMPVPKIQTLARWSGKSLEIPQFSLQDQNGTTWTLDRLKGKTTLINIWATWCGPCRAELPLIQKLYEQIKDREDIQVITLNTDEDASLVQPYLKENKLTVPSLFARDFVNAFSKPMGIPLTWISDTSGTIRWESLGFGGESPDWITQTLAQMMRVRGGP
ncbi:MAG: redoxin family protein [Acidobacteria bacterium]|nr:redoxin family protein [Acidobacteriota bacterium]